MNNLFNTVIAAFEAIEPSDHEALVTWALDNETALMHPPEVKTDVQYEAYYELKRTLSNAWCGSRHNDSRDTIRRLAACEDRIAQALWHYNRKTLVRHRESNLVARYLLTRRGFKDVPIRTAMLLAKACGVLRWEPHADTGFPVLYVVGLERRVGNNVFTVTKTGRHYRRFLRTIGKQAFVPCKAHDFSPQELAQFCEGLARIDETYHVTYVGDFKGGARESCFDGKACSDLYALLTCPAAQALSLSDAGGAVSNQPPLKDPAGEHDELCLQMELNLAA